MSNLHDEYSIDLFASLNILDLDVVKRLEEMLTPNSSQRISQEAKTRINEIANELKSYVSSSSFESDSTYESSIKSENDLDSPSNYNLNLGSTSSHGPLCMVKSEPRIFSNEYLSTSKDKSKAYREKKKLKNEQMERQLYQKMALNENLKNRVELLESATKLLREIVNRNMHSR
jgi:hypothetical protein